MITEYKDDVLMKNNILVKAKYSLSLAESRIFIMMLYGLQKDVSGSMSFKISLDELKKLVKKKEKNTVLGITRILDDIMSKHIFFMEEKANGKGKIWSKYNFINGYDYDDELKSFRIECSERVYILLKSYLDTGYTPVNLSIWLSLCNNNAQRFYDLLRLWSGTKSIVNYKIDELKDLLMIEDKYDKYNDFKRRIIVPAIKELNDTGYFEIDFKENKVGRKVDSIDFTVKDLDKRKYFTKDIVGDVPILEEVAITCDDINEKVDMINIDSNIDSKPKNKNVEKTDLKISISDLYIPDEEIFTKGTLRSFKLDFKNIDFKNEYMERAFNYAISITMERDDVDNIKVSSYKFFKGCLENKIVEYRLEEQEEIKHKKDMDMHW
ncbi:MAG: replication initiation protein [Paraclostridium sp.]